jgi:hypothetical protein
MAHRAVFLASIRKGSFFPDVLRGLKCGSGIFPLLFFGAGRCMRAFLQRCPNDFLFPDSLLLVSFAIFAPFERISGEEICFCLGSVFFGCGEEPIY